MPIVCPADRILNMIGFYCSPSGMQCRPNGGYGVTGKKKRKGIGETEDQNDFIIQHVSLGKRLPEKTKLYFYANGMRSGVGMLPARNVWPGGGESYS